MNMFQFMSLFSGAATVVIGCFAYFSHPSKTLNQSFLILTVTIAFWQVNVFMGMSSTESEALIFWIKESSAFAALIPPFMNQMRLSIVHPGKSTGKLLWKNRIWLGIAALVFLMAQTSWFLKDALPPESGQVLPTPVYGFAFQIFGFYFVCSFSVLFYLMFTNNRNVSGGGKTELEYLLLSCGSGLFVGVFFLIVPHLTGWNDLGALLPVSVIVFSAITGYGIATRGILDVSVLLRRIISYAMLIIYLAVLYILTYHIAGRLLRLLSYEADPLAGLIAALAVAFSVSPAQGVAQKLANRLFITSQPLDVGKILSDAGRTLNTVLTVDELCSRLHGILQKNLETTELRIFVREGEVFSQMYPADTLRKIPVKAPLPSYLSSQRTLCIRELMDRRRPSESGSLVNRELEEENLSAAIAFHRKHNMYGFLLLGPRSSGRVYTREETVAIEGLRDLFAVSFDNAQLYTELQNGRIYMDLLLKNLVNGVLATDASGIITTCNQEASRILDSKSSELIGKKIEHLPPELAEMQRQVLNEDLRIRDREIRLGEEEGNPVYLYAGASLFRNLKGETIGSLLVMQDRTAIRNLEEQVKRSERLASLGTLSAGMAHEIKNPLVTLQTFTQLLPERYLDEEYRETFVNLASKEISRIDGLVNKLLTLARPVKLELQDLSLHELLEKYTKLFRQQAQDADVRLLENYGASRDTITADGDQLWQVILNLLLNAQQAMPEGGDIHLVTRDAERGVELEIRDTGEGISPEKLHHIFDPFFTTKSAGTGLGLAVAHQILQEHHTVVRVESTPGDGTAFVIFFAQPEPETLR